MEIKILVSIPNWFRNSLFTSIEFKKKFNPKANSLMEEHEEHKKNVAALKLLEQKGKQFYENISLINDLRRVIIYRYRK